MKPVRVLLVIGVISGLLEVAYMHFKLPELRLTVGNSGTSLAPGLIYGVFLGAGLSWLNQRAGGRFVLSMVFTAVLVTVAWYVPTWLALEIHDSVTNNMIVIGFLAGALGGAMMAGSAAILFEPFRNGRLALTLVGVGAVAGLLLGVEDLEIKNWPFGLFLFPIWQGAVSAVLGRSLPASG